MSHKITPRILSGFMELLPDEQLILNQMKKIIADSYESFGFTELDTPTLELSEILLAKAGGETEKQIYRFNKGDSDLCMRFDLTVPLARYVAQHQNELTFPFKRYQIAKVYRGERPQHGRFREFYQADIDIIGSEKLSLTYDAEIPCIIYHIFTKLGLKHFQIHMNNRKLLQGFYESLGLSAQITDILRIIDKMDKIGIKNVQACLTDLGLKTEDIENIVLFSSFQGQSDIALNQLKKTTDNALFQEGLYELKTVINSLKALGVPETHFMIDLKITRGLDYYTGTVYETFVPDFPTWGSICSGGRYENLAEYYTDRKLPGVGISIGLTRFFDLLREKDLLNHLGKTTTTVLVIPMSENEVNQALKIGQELRSEGIRVDVFSTDAKLKNKLAYADKMKIPYVVILGENEMQTQTVVLKDMEKQTQQTVPQSKLAPSIRLLCHLRPADTIIKNF